MQYSILFLFLLFACSTEQTQSISLRDDFPDQESWGVQIILTDEGIIRAKVQSGHLKKYNEKEFILLDSSVTVDFFDENENHTSILLSQKAEIDQSTNNMKAIGNVVAISDSGITLYTETLTWDSKEENLITKDDIMITTLESDTLYGVGFKSDSDLKNWRILSPSGVTGVELK